MNKKTLSLYIFLATLISLKMASAQPTAFECPSAICQENVLNLPVDGSSIDDIPLPPPFQTPAADYQLNSDYSHLDPNNLIPKAILNQALKFYELNLALIPSTRFLSVIDFSLHSSQKRFYLIDMLSGEVKSMLSSVGRGTDPDGDGIANFFSNEPGSNKSSLGFYLTDDEYVGGSGRSMRLHGLNDSNNNALKRLIVVHGSLYISDQDNYAGRSLGCPAVDMKNIDELIDKTKKGSLLYIWHSSI